MLRALAEHRLRRVLPERAGAAAAASARSVAIRSTVWVLRVIAASRRFWALCGSVAASAIMTSVALAAPAINGSISAPPGRLRQYFFGISFCIAFTFRRAGLKMLA